MATIGRGVREIRIRDEDGAWRAICLATLPDAVHVYHVFQKKTRKTAKPPSVSWIWPGGGTKYEEHMRSLK